MKTTNTPNHTPVAVSLEIFTYLPIRSDFAKDTGGYLDRNNLWAAVSPNSIKMLEEVGKLSSKFEMNASFSNSSIIHLVRHDAIVITTEGEGERVAIKTIMVNLGILLYNDPDYPVVESDLLGGLSLLIDVISPLLADPLRDACRIVPGLEEGDWRTANWQGVYASMLIPGVGVRDLHVSGIKDRISCSLDSDFVRIIDQSNRVNVWIEDAVLSPLFVLEWNWDWNASSVARVTAKFCDPEWVGDPPDDSRVFSLRTINVASRFHKTIASLGVKLFAAPAGDSEEEDHLITRRAMAISSELAAGDRRLMSFIERILMSSRSSLEELKVAGAAESSRLNPVPISDLIARSSALQEACRIGKFDWPIHPLISAVLACDSEALAS